MTRLGWAVRGWTTCGWVTGALMLGTACSSDGMPADDDLGVDPGGSGGVTTDDGSSAGGTGGSGGAAPPPADCSEVTDECPFDAGIEFACVRRFGLGVNYAWRDFGADFGGLATWSIGGVSANAATYSADLARMKQNGASIVRWWMFPDLRGDGVTRDASGTPTGLSEKAIADVQKALELARDNDLYLALTLFSFDAFRPTRDEGGVTVPGISELVRSEPGRAALVEHVVVPVARAVAASPHAERLFAWDVINEPEWAVSPTGNAPVGGEFEPNDELDPVPLADMKAILDAALAALATETPQIERSVGWAAAKWAWAFDDVTQVTFHQPHIYAWVNDYWPYTTPPAELGYPAGPVVMGEFYMMDGPFGATPTFQTVLDSWYQAGYAGAWAWDYYAAHIAQPPDTSLDPSLVADFASSRGCSVSYP